MEGLRALAGASLADQKFQKQSPEYEYDVAVIDSDRAATLHDARCADAMLSPSASTNTSRSTSTSASASSRHEAGRRTIRLPELPEFLDRPAALRLLMLRRDEKRAFCIARSGFDSIWDAMRANPCALVLVCQEYDGYHHFPSNEPHTAPTWFLGMSKYALLWTFDCCSSSTTALFLHRKEDLFAGLFTMLDIYKACTHTPYLIGFAMCLHTLAYFSRETNTVELVKTQTIEQQVGFGPYCGGSDRSKTRFEIQEVTGWSREVGEVQGQLANKHRHLTSIRAMLDALERREGLEAIRCARCVRDTDLLAEVLPVVGSQLATYVDFVEYLKDRAGKLSHVLFALLTHEDAENNKDLVLAGKDLALAQKRDSSTMKAIAVLTMLFLPASFVAAIFSLPMLDWKSARPSPPAAGGVQGSPRVDVITSQFKYYWLVAMPFTFVVFTIWFTVTQRWWLGRRVRQLVGCLMCRPHIDLADTA